MPDQPPRLPKPDRDRSVQEALSAHAALRERTVDDQMFSAGKTWGIPCTFWLQIFTAPRHRSVAVVTQTPDEGTSLTNAAERYASRVWELHAPDAPEPPIWIQHYVESAQQQSTDEFDLVPFPWMAASSESPGGCRSPRISSPRWSVLRSTGPAVSDTSLTPPLRRNDSSTRSWTSLTFPSRLRFGKPV
ncbi:hypothetical protein ACFWZK_35455 [[Kitasatospora] papulosa]|uniref:hypothetical protein n=1 Tax=[Kitasatospora] papulosa TaxID=1464011 RepID=UPI0036CB455D